MPRRGGRALLILALCAAGLGAIPRARAHRWGTEDAIARLERLKDDVAEQERRVDAIRKAVQGGSGSKSMTCSAHDQECHRQERRDRRRKVACRALLSARPGVCVCVSAHTSCP